MYIQTLSGSFGFDTMIDYGTERSFIGNNPRSGTWYVNMRQHTITLSITDLTGNSVTCTLDNEDNSLSGLDASILIKMFFAYVETAVKRNNRINRKQVKTVNGRNVLMLWTNKKG